MKFFVKKIWLLEYGLLWFSIAVPVTGVIAFSFGGSCSLWQWWAAAVLVIAFMFFRRDRREAVAATVWMLVWLGAVWVMCGVLANPGGWDENAYHFPAVRLLADGWNPLFVRTPETFRETYGFVQGDMEVYHALFQMKGVWLFNAIAMKFTGEFFSPMLPMTLVLFPAVAVRLSRLADGFTARAISVMMLFLLIPRSFFSLDAVLVLSTFGLLACMFAFLKGERADVSAMAGYTVLMAASKLNGLYQSVLVWAVFGAVVLVMRMPLKRLFVALAIAFAAFMPLAVTPFMTAVMDYGNPLYPHVSCDPANPAVDICGDFEWKRNGDMKSLGHFESLVNAYVSPSLVQSLKAGGRSGFCPRNQMFEHYPGLSSDGGVSALHPSVRILFWISVIALCSFGGASGALIAFVSVLGIAAVPTRMVGYVRYVPWMLAPLLFLPVVLFRLRSDAMYRRLVALMTVAAMSAVRPLSLQRQIFDAAWDINSGAIARELLEDGRAAPPGTLYPPQSQRWKASLELTRRRFPLLCDAVVVDRWGDDLLSIPEWLSVFPCGLFGYDATRDFTNLNAGIEAERVHESRIAKLRFSARTFFITVPKLVIRRIF